MTGGRGIPSVDVYPMKILEFNKTLSFLKKNVCVRVTFYIGDSF